MKYTEWHHEVHGAQRSVLHDATRCTSLLRVLLLKIFSEWCPPRDEYRTKFNELFANEFNLVEKPPHARDFRSSILELYHNRKMRSTHKHVLPSVKGSSWSEERSPPHQTAAYDRSSPCRISADDRSSPRQMMSVDEFSPTGRDY